MLWIVENFLAISLTQWRDLYLEWNYGWILGASDNNHVAEVLNGESGDNNDDKDTKISIMLCTLAFFRRLTLFKLYTYTHMCIYMCVYTYIKYIYVWVYKRCTHTYIKKYYVKKWFSGDWNNK
jgi:hypothetical protein